MDWNNTIQKGVGTLIETIATESPTSFYIKILAVLGALSILGSIVKGISFGLFYPVAYVIGFFKFFIDKFKKS